MNHRVSQGTDGWSFHPVLCMTLLLLFITNTKDVLTWEGTLLLTHPIWLRKNPAPGRPLGSHSWSIPGWAGQHG